MLQKKQYRRRVVVHMRLRQLLEAQGMSAYGLDKVISLMLKTILLLSSAIVRLSLDQDATDGRAGGVWRAFREAPAPELPPRPRHPATPHGRLRHRADDDEHPRPRGLPPRRAAARRLGRRGGRFFSSRRRHTRFEGDWSSDVCSSD